jgi:hypothetical protein
MGPPSSPVILGHILVNKEKFISIYAFPMPMDKVPVYVTEVEVTKVEEKRGANVVAPAGSVKPRLFDDGAPGIWVYVGERQFMIPFDPNIKVYANDHIRKKEYRIGPPDEEVARSQKHFPVYLDLVLVCGDKETLLSERYSFYPAMLIDVTTTGRGSDSNATSRENTETNYQKIIFDVKPVVDCGIEQIFYEFHWMDWIQKMEDVRGVEEFKRFRDMPIGQTLRIMYNKSNVTPKILGTIHGNLDGGPCYPEHSDSMISLENLTAKWKERVSKFIY